MRTLRAGASPRFTTSTATAKYEPCRSTEWETVSRGAGWLGGGARTTRTVRVAEALLA